METADDCHDHPSEDEKPKRPLTPTLAQDDAIPKDEDVDDSAASTSADEQPLRGRDGATLTIGRAPPPRRRNGDDVATATARPQPASAIVADRRVPDLTARGTLLNFLLLSVLFSANHGGVVACLSLATARLGTTVGAWQSGALYLSYTASSLLGPTYVVKHIGARDTLLLGMAVYCVYVFSFVLALWSSPSARGPVAIIGALIGGVGAGHLWTAQGSYFTRAAEEYSAGRGIPQEDATSFLGALFAAIYLALELVMRLFSSVAIEAFGLSWIGVFISYTIIAYVSAAGMFCVHNYHSTARERSHNDELTPLRQVTVAGRLLFTDAKMKYMIPLNAVFGFAAAFVNAYVNGEVLREVLGEHDQSIYVGILTSVTSGVAAVASLVFGYVDQRVGKGPVLALGSVCFFAVAFVFAVRPSASSWGLPGLAAVYSLQGVGRATFEGTLRAEFADFFSEEREGAFANIVLQNGLSTAVGYFLSVNLRCSVVGPYCARFEDGSLHNVLAFELLVMSTAVLAILGYTRAAVLFASEKDEAEARRLMDDGNEDDARLMGAMT